MSAGALPYHLPPPRPRVGSRRAEEGLPQVEAIPRAVEEVAARRPSGSRSHDDDHPGRHMELTGFRARMLPGLDEIPRLRRALGLSQARLASMAGISQSAVAKIEHGKSSPSYAVVKRLLECLEAERQQKERVATVADVRSRRVVSVGPRTLLEAAVAEMRRHRFSQLPVIEDGNPVGSFSERTITHLILSGKKPADFSRIRVEQVMEAPFPTIDEKAPVYLAAGLLQHYPAVLATAHGEVQGIVTKSDILKLV